MSQSVRRRIRRRSVSFSPLAAAVPAVRYIRLLPGDFVNGLALVPSGALPSDLVVSVGLAAFEAAEGGFEESADLVALQMPVGSTVPVYVPVRFPVDPHRQFLGIRASSPAVGGTFSVWFDVSEAFEDAS